MAIKNKGITEVFNGQSDIVVFDEVEDYTTATVNSIVATGQSLGQVVEDSTSWDGEEPSLDSINDEKGNVIVVNPSSGSYAFSCDVASLDDDFIKLFLKGKDVTVTGTGGSFGDVTKAVKFGTDLPVITRPIAIINDEANKIILFPKAEIIANFSLDSKLWRIHISATAQYLDTTNLGTCMKFDGTPKYEA